MLEVLERLTSQVACAARAHAFETQTAHSLFQASRRLGMGDQFSYGYLVGTRTLTIMPWLTMITTANKGFAVDDDGIIHYLTGSPLRRDFVRVLFVNQPRYLMPLLVHSSVQSRRQTRKGEAKGLSLNLVECNRALSTILTWQALSISISSLTTLSSQTLFGGTWSSILLVVFFTYFLAVDGHQLQRAAVS